MSPSAHVRRLVLVLALLACAGPVPARAQMVLPLPGNVTLDTPTQTDFQAGFSSEGSITLLVIPTRNRRWQLHIRAASPDMGGGKPTSDVYWRTSSSGSWAPLSTSYVPLAEGRGFQLVTLQVRTRLQWALDQAGTYNAPVEFGLTSG